MNSIENLIVEFISQIDIDNFVIVILGVLFFSILIFSVLRILQKKEENNKFDKKQLKFFLFFLLFIYIVGLAALVKGCFGTKNNSIVNLNNKYNIFIQDKNNIEFYYVPKNEEVKDENIVKKAHLKITVEQAKDEKYYLYFNKNIDEKKEVKKEEIKDFIQNIKKQENYIDTNKIKKITLKDFE